MDEYSSRKDQYDSQERGRIESQRDGFFWFIIFTLFAIYPRIVDVPRFIIEKINFELNAVGGDMYVFKPGMPEFFLVVRICFGVISVIILLILFLDRKKH